MCRIDIICILVEEVPRSVVSGGCLFSFFLYQYREREFQAASILDVGC